MSNANKILVNIYNEGQILGVRTPVYNFPMDRGIYQLLLEMGVQIEIAKGNNTIVEPAKPKPVEKVVVQENEPRIEVADTYKVTEEVKDEQTQMPSVEAEAWMTKDVYTMNELSTLSREELVKILNYRGHYSSKTGKRDKFAPKYDDNKTILADKIIKTNKSN